MSMKFMHKKERKIIMELSDRVKEFKKTMHNGIWQWRRDVVKKDVFVNCNLQKSQEARQLLIRAALCDPATEVRREARNTCNMLGIKHKGKSIRVRKMESIYKIIKKFYGREKANKHIYIAIIHSGVDLTNRERSLTKEEHKQIRRQLSKEYPKLHDLIDGRFAVNGKIQKDKFFYKKFRNIPQDMIEHSDKRLN